MLLFLQSFTFVFATPVPVVYDTFVMEYFMSQILEDKTGKPKNEILSWMLTNDIAEKAYAKIKAVDLKQYVFLKTLEWSVAHNKNQIEATDLVTDGVYISDSATIKANVNSVISDGMISLSEVNAKSPFASFVFDEYEVSYPPTGTFNMIRREDNTVYSRNFDYQYFSLSYVQYPNNPTRALFEMPRNNVKIYIDTVANPKQIYAVKFGTVSSALSLNRMTSYDVNVNSFFINKYVRKFQWESLSGKPAFIVNLPGATGAVNITTSNLTADVDGFTNSWETKYKWSLLQNDNTVYTFNGTGIISTNPDIPVENPETQLSSNVLTLSQALTTFNKGLTGQQDQITDLLNQQTQVETSTLGLIDTMNGTLEDIYEGVEGSTNLLEKIWNWLAGVQTFFTQLALSLFVPSSTYFNNFFNDLQIALLGKTDFDFSALDQFRLNSGRFQDITIMIYGKEITIVESDYINNALPTIHGFIRGIFFVLLFFYNYRMILFLIRGSGFINVGNSTAAQPVQTNETGLVIFRGGD